MNIQLTYKDIHQVISLHPHLDSFWVTRGDSGNFRETRRLYEIVYLNSENDEIEAITLNYNDFKSYIKKA